MPVRWRPPGGLPWVPGKCPRGDYLVARLFQGPYCATNRHTDEHRCLCVKPFGMWNRLQLGVVITRSSITWYFRDSALAGTAVIHCFNTLIGKTVQPLLPPNQPTNMILQSQWLRQKINQEFEFTKTLTDELMGFVWRYILNCFYLFICVFIYC